MICSFTNTLKMERTEKTARSGLFIAVIDGLFVATLLAKVWFYCFFIFTVLYLGVLLRVSVCLMPCLSAVF